MNRPASCATTSVQVRSSCKVTMLPGGRQSRASDLHLNPIARLRSALWTRDSSLHLGGFLLVVFLIVYIWWPLAVAYLAYVDWKGTWWQDVDWLLLGVFLFMSFTIVAKANLRADALIIVVGVFGGLSIEALGTQTNLWSYYTSERPPLWIIPAWPIAALSIDRITRFLDWLLKWSGRHLHSGSRFTTRELPGAARPGRLSACPPLYWLTFAAFLLLMAKFVAPTFHQPATILAYLVCIAFVAAPGEHRRGLLTFLAGAALGYFLELWGTTRECWTYYTHETPPIFAVLAHGMAALAFWRAGKLVQSLAHSVIPAALAPGQANPLRDR